MNSLTSPTWDVKQNRQCYGLTPFRKCFYLLTHALMGDPFTAATLMDVITTANLNDMHGHTSDLTDKERQQLVDYLLQIDESEIVTTAST